MGRTTSITAGAALLAATLTLTACGGDGDKKAEAKATVDAAKSSAPSGGENAAKSPAELVTTSLNRFKSAKSVRLTVDYRDEGKPVHIDFRLGVDQADGTMQGSFGSQNATTKLRSVGGKLYMSGDASFWGNLTGDNAMGQKLGGKWVAVPVGEVKEFKAFLGIRQFDQEIFAQLRKTFPAASGGLVSSRTDVKGVPAVGIAGPGGKEALVFVAASGAPDLLRFRSSESIGDMPKGEFDFSEYDAPLQIQAPTDVIDLGKEMGK
ncbi:hypothetical protein [Actinomadura rupiterrae]|uniref:hypothetical protein n=1 Tax=Actinomadura rupiterrae TaxID=559627 RepID=UPI0020A5643B|nr:hypothetical protein [Actinomadura rupiterrae]MCP2339610.1 hypothetical protein [Actinomadura rupiterrae]